VSRTADLLGDVGQVPLLEDPLLPRSAVGVSVGRAVVGSLTHRVQR
jgi:hypothetical protein